MAGYPVIYGWISGNLVPDIQYFRNGVSGQISGNRHLNMTGYLVMLTFAGYPVCGYLAKFLSGTFLIYFGSMKQI